MTRDDYRAKCIEEMIKNFDSLWMRKAGFYTGAQLKILAMTAAFDALHGIAFIEPLEATEEMIDTAHPIYSNWVMDSTALCGADLFRKIFEDMCPVGDLTNPPEKKT